MTDLRLSGRELEDLLAGRQPDGRADLADLAEITAVLHASREVEPPPPISEALRAQIGQDVPRPQAPARRRRRHRPRHMQAVTPGRAGIAALRRPVGSVAAAAAVLVALVLVTSSGHLPSEVNSAVADVGSAIGLDLFQRDDAAGTETSEPVPPSTTSTTPPTTAAPTTTVPPETTTTAPPSTAPTTAPPPPGDAQLPWWLQPEFWQHYGERDGGDGSWGGDGGSDGGWDGDRDGDSDGSGTGRGGGGGDQPSTDSPDAYGPNTTPPPTTAAPASTSTSAGPTPTPPPT